VPTLKKRIEQLRGRLKGLYTANGMSLLGAGLAGVVLFSFACDYLFHLPVAVRVFLLAASACCIGYVFYRYLMRPLSVQMSDDDMALYYEGAYPEAQDRLISAVQLQRVMEQPGYPYSASLTRSVIGQAEEFARGLDARRLRPTPKLKQNSAVGGALLVVVAFLVISSPTLFGIWAQRFFLLGTEWPRKTDIEVQYYDPLVESENEERHWKSWDTLKKKKGVLKIVRGEDVRLRIRARRGNPHAVWVYYRGEKVKSRLKIERNPVTPRRYEWVFPQVINDISFHAEGGDHRTHEHTIVALIPPRIREVEIGYTLPAYTRPSPDEQARRYNTGDVKTIPGTTVLFSATTNVPVTEGRLDVTQGAKAEAVMLRIEDGGKRIAGEFRVTESGEYQVFLVSREGLENREKVPFAITILPDLAPTVSITHPARDMKVLADSKIPILIHAEDDFGLNQIGVFYRVKRAAAEDEQDTELPVALPPRGVLTEADAEVVFDLAPLDLKEGNEVTYFARASDFNDVADRPGVGDSNRYRLIVVSRETLEREIDALGEEILKDLKQLRDNQIRTHGDTGELAERVRADGKFTEKHTKRLFVVAMYQEYVATKCDEISLKLTKMMEDIIAFELTQRKLIDHLKVTDEIVRTVGRVKSPAALAEIKAAPTQGSTPDEMLVRAGKRQKEIIEDLTAAIELMTEFARLSDVIRGIQGVLENEKSIRHELLERYREKRKEEDK
jgi:hypothetical protein